MVSNVVIWIKARLVRYYFSSFTSHKSSRFYLGNCWFIAGAGAVTLNPDLLQRVVPSNQTFEEDNYAGNDACLSFNKIFLIQTGIFHFRFWLYGQWYDVVVDDQLPFHSDGRLVFCRNKKDKNEMWAPLLEKAYAK